MKFSKNGNDASLTIRLKPFTEKDFSIWRLNTVFIKLHLHYKTQLLLTDMQEIKIPYFKNFIFIK